MRYLMFESRFAALIVAGIKTSTVRREFRACSVGEPVSLRAWSGMAYRSPQRELAQVTITCVAPFLAAGGSAPIMIGGRALTKHDRDILARKEGFRDRFEMLEYFASYSHGMFRGAYVSWEPRLLDDPFWTARTPRQQQLRSAHGNPREFAIAVWRCPDVSCSEAKAAVDAYVGDWFAAAR
ncbi:MAG: ASCH domain-containing protein [Verrucomicrobiales bacterium]|nr:ASCH domain-containing protein [Verrucomicrobiales bacterium]